MTMHPDTCIIPRSIHPQAGPSYAELAAQCDATHAQLVTMIKSTHDRETGWQLVIAAAFVAGAIVGIISWPLATILVGSVTP